MGFREFLAHPWNDTMTVLPIASVSVMCELLEVFPDDLPVMPLDSEFDYCIDLEIGTHPISIPIYMMSPIELMELKDLVTRVVGKGVYLSEHFSLGCLCVFYKEKWS